MDDFQVLIAVMRAERGWGEDLELRASPCVRVIAVSAPEMLMILEYQNASL